VSVTKIRALLLPVGEPARVVELDDAVEGLQAAIGGFFEALGSFPCGPGRVADVWIDEEGMLKELPENRLVLMPGFEGVILGPIVLTASGAAGSDNDDGETYSLTDEELAFVLRVVEQWPVVE
jgi:hypothetical protein